MHKYSVLLLDTYFAGFVSISGALIGGIQQGWTDPGSGGEYVCRPFFPLC